MKMRTFSSDDIENARITHKSDIQPKEPTIYIRDSIYAIKGSFSIVSGLPKSGKTTVIRTLFTTSLMQDIPSTFDNLFIRATYCNDNPIIYFNTEMTDSDTKDFHDKIIHDLNINETPLNLYIFHLLEFSPAERLNFIKAVYQHIPHIHLSIIDGGADLVTSVNEEKESNEVIAELSILAQKHRSTIVQIIHENRGNQKVRGHYGQQAERKCCAAISVAKEADGTFRIESNICRHSEDFKSIYFGYDKDYRRMRTIDKQVSTKDTVKDELKMAIKECFKESKVLPKKELNKILARVLNPHEEKISDATRKLVARQIKKSFTLQYITTNNSPESIRICMID